MDPQLTKKGVGDAKKLGRILKDKKIDVAFHSRLSRSKDTLSEVLKFHPECKRVLEDDRIIERSYGDLEGLYHDNFVKNVGRKLFDLSVYGDYMSELSGEDKNEIEKFLGEKEYEIIHRGYKAKAKNGESFADVEKRVKSFIKYLKKFMRKKKVNVAISAHGNSIRLFRKIMEKANIQEMASWVIPYDKVFEYEF
jgi:bisphosphoglycerate-dependent phosphoglycerate mutase